MGVEVWWSTLTAVDRSLTVAVSPAELARAEAYERPADRGRSLLGAALLRATVAERLGVRPVEVVVDRTCSDCGGGHGRPRILGPGSALPWVSVSHSGVLVVVAISTDGPIGVDVQRVADLADPEEAGAWVRGEARLKAGRGDARELAAPLPGYVGALVTAGAAGSVEPIVPVVRHWPDPSPSTIEPVSAGRRPPAWRRCARRPVVSAGRRPAPRRCRRSADSCGR